MTGRLAGARCSRPGHSPVEVAARNVAEMGGGAWTVKTLGGCAISYLPERDRNPLTDDGRPGAHLTWYRPGEHILGLTSDECDDILASTEREVRSVNGGVIETVDPSGPHRWVWERVRDLFAAANTVIVFPSTLPHRVTPVTAGTRRTLVGFAIEKPLERSS